MKAFLVFAAVLFITAAMNGCIGVDLYELLEKNGEVLVGGEPCQVTLYKLDGIKLVGPTVTAVEKIRPNQFLLVPGTGLLFELLPLKQIGKEILITMSLEFRTVTGYKKGDLTVRISRQRLGQLIADENFDGQVLVGWSAPKKENEEIEPLDINLAPGKLPSGISVDFKEVRIKPTTLANIKIAK